METASERGLADETTTSSTPIFDTHIQRAGLLQWQWQSGLPPVVPLSLSSALSIVKSCCFTARWLCASLTILGFTPPSWLLGRICGPPLLLYIHLRYLEL